MGANVSAPSRPPPSPPPPPPSPPRPQPLPQPQPQPMIQTQPQPQPAQLPQLPLPITGRLTDDIDTILKLQDVQLSNAMNKIKNNPTALNNYIASRKGELYSSITNEHSDTFAKVFGDLQRASDTTNNIMYYSVRNKDLDRLQEIMLKRQMGEAENAAYDNQISKRQFQINQWTNGNKMDTLFFLQLLFIYLTLTAPMVYLKNLELLPSSVFYGVMGLLTFALVMTIVVRAQYTNKTRDQHLWNRRRFASMGGPPTAITCPAVTGAIDDSIKYLKEYQKDIGTKMESAGNKIEKAFDILST